MSSKIHYTAQYLINPRHPVTVCLIGLGGNGSSMLSNLARIHKTLIELEHPGLHIMAFDPDIVTEANLGRQLFSVSDLGRNKAQVLIERMNRFFDTRWVATPGKFDAKRPKRANIYITCVDSLSARRQIYRGLRKPFKTSTHHQQPYYWMDLGNSADFGQFILKNLGPIAQPESEFETVREFPGLFEMFPKMKTKRDDKNEPSCSLAEAIEKQDLFINSAVALNAAHLVWKMFREARIDYHGAFVNLATSEINKISF